MYLIGVVLALLIGVVLGLIGGGGSILTIPLVVYVFGTSFVLATTYSLFVVTMASGIGAIQRIRSGHVDLRQGILFVIPSMICAFLFRAYVLPTIPLEFKFAGLSILRDQLISGALIAVMLFIGIRLFLGKKNEARSETSRGKVVLYGMFTGLLSGLIGAGGGFIIVPILLSMGLSMKKAVGTSMFIISVQSAVALCGDFIKQSQSSEVIDWPLLFLITGITIGGVLLGTYLQRFFSGKLLKKFFSLVLISLSVGMFVAEFLF